MNDIISLKNIVLHQKVKRKSNKRTLQSYIKIRVKAGNRIRNL